MADGSTILFQRGQTSDNELWDDTALIKAYDNAVKQMKAKIKVENGEEVESTDGGRRNTSKGANKKKKNKRKRNKSKKRKWSVGDHCRAVYTEDDLVYDAEIISLDEEKGTCVVEYKGYGNEEEHNLDDLLTVSSGHKSKLASDIETDLDSMDWCGESPNSRPKTSGGQRSRNHTMHNDRYNMPGGHMFPPYGGMPPPPQPFHMPPMSSYPFTGHGYPAGLPMMPPPPPMPAEDPSTDNEAMCSMLMSWYMSGYHTGYYQGLKQARLSGSLPPHSDSGR